MKQFQLSYLWKLKIKQLHNHYEQLQNVMEYNQINLQH